MGAITSLRIDHILYCTRDLQAAAADFLDRFGLASVEGGRHVGWGTANRIVPLGSDYVELLGIVDEREAAGNPLGRRLQRQLEEGDRPIGWAVATDDLDGVARRLGLDVNRGSRMRPDGLTLRWRSAGVDRAMEEEGVPFFLTWEVTPELHPGATPAPHRVRPRGITRVEVTGDAERIRRWVGQGELPVVIEDGPPRMRGVAIATDGGEIFIA